MRQNYILFLGIACLLLASIKSVIGLHCWTCENAQSIEECDKIGKLQLCNPTQDTCGMEIRQNDGVPPSRVKVFKFCKQKHACMNVQNQNDKEAWQPTQCNPKFPNSVCRCCCQEDRCNLGDMKCLDMTVTKTCSPQVYPDNGVVSCTNASNIGSECTFTCGIDTFLVGPERITCQSNEKWSARAPICSRLSCPKIPDLENGSTKCNMAHELGSVCRFTCDKGYSLVGHEAAICQSNKDDKTLGDWSTKGQRCEMKKCELPLAAPANGVMACTKENYVGSSCGFGCNKSYELKGTDTSTCEEQITGHLDWTDRAPTCERKECAALENFKNGRIECSDDNLIGSVCQFICDANYEVVGPQSSTCQENYLAETEWSEKMPTCKARECPSALSTPANGVVRCSNGVSVGSVCQFSCHVGYELKGAEESTCMSPEIGSADAKGQRSYYGYGGIFGFYITTGDDKPTESPIPGSPFWSDREPECKRKQCKDLPMTPYDGNVHCDQSYYLGSTCTFLCDSSHYREGPETITCIEEPGYYPDWSSEGPICKPKECAHNLAPPENGSIDCNKGKFLGSYCRYTCKSAYYLVGDEIVTCVEDSYTNQLRWDNTETPICIRKECPAVPTEPQNGHKYCTDMKFLGSVCEFQCYDDFDLVGSARVTCVEEYESGELRWDNESPTCERKKCSYIPMKPVNGKMQCSEKNYYGSVCVFECDSKYEISGLSYIMCGVTYKKKLSLRPEWDAESPKCIKKQCKTHPYAPENGRVVCTDGNNIDSKCEFVCNEFYNRVGPLYTICYEGPYEYMSWTNDAPTCERSACPELKHIKHGNMECTDETYINSKCKFECTKKDYALSPDDRFSITCQNNTQWSEKPPCCARACPPFAVMDLIVVLDSSSSIGFSSWYIMLRFIEEIFSQFRVQPDAMNFGVVRYNRYVDSVTQIDLNDCPDNVTRLREEVNKLPYNGEGTYTGQALEYVRTSMFTHERGDREKVTNVVLVITDGRSQDDVAEPAQKLREDGVVTFALAIKPGKGRLDLEQLSDIAGSESNLFMAETGFSKLTPEFASEISGNICGDPCEKQIF